MVRPCKLRKIALNLNCTYFKPRAIPLTELEEVILAHDALEAVRLVDLEGLYQDEAAERMGVSRPTIGRILEQARKTIVDALINGKAIKIEGGNVAFDQSDIRGVFRGRGRCGRGWKR